MLHNYFLPVIKYLFPYETAKFFLLNVGIQFDPKFRSVSTLCWFHLYQYIFYDEQSRTWRHLDIFEHNVQVSK